jgi:hypothetical protein
LLVATASLVVFAQGKTPSPATTAGYYTATTEILQDGRSVDRIVINGPPTPPTAIERPIAEGAEPHRAAGSALLAVPAYNWSFGCSATSAAIIAAYYDRNGYPNMYTGPTNGGVMPMDNSSWPDWWDGHEWRHQCPLSATHNGLDGRTTRGHVDDYWIQYNEPGPDPYDTNGWTEHTPGECTGDFMKTNKWFSGEGFNVDGATTFWNYTDGSPLYASDLEGYGKHIYDGGYGWKLFYESRGYTVTSMYNQYIYGYDGNGQGFTYNQYKAEIDAGRPVMVHVQGHTMVGVGYDDTTTNMMYIHDTWDYDTHTMVWGTNYLGMDHYGVTIVQLAEPLIPDAPSGLAAVPVSQSQINLAWVDNSANELGFKIERSPLSPGSWTQVGSVGPGVTTYPDTGLTSNTTYYYRVRAYNASGDSGYSNVASARTWGGVRYWAYLPSIAHGYGGPGGAIQNGDFEDGATGWTEYSSHGWSLIIDSGFPSGVSPHGGSWAVWLGGGNSETGYIEQELTVPTGAPYLHYWHWIQSDDILCGYDFASLRINGTPVHTYDLCTTYNTGGWQEYVVDLGAFAGQSVALQLRVETDVWFASSLFVDDVSLSASAALGP